MNMFDHPFHKCDDYWLCNSLIGGNWFIFRQPEPSIIVEFNHDTQSGKIVGIGGKIIGKVPNCKEYNKELKEVIAFTKAYIKDEKRKQNKKG